MIKTHNLHFSKRYLLTSDTNPSFGGILSGLCKGDVWVDALEQPSLALVYSQPVGGFSILGNPNTLKSISDLKVFLEESLFPKLIAQGSTAFEFTFESKDTETRLLSLFKTKYVQEEVEFFYEKTSPCSLDIKASYPISHVTTDFLKHLKNTNLEAYNALENKILESWSSLDYFLENGLAYVIKDKNHLIGYIMGTALYENKLSIDIEIYASYRQQHLASNLTYHFVNKCIEKGYVACWNCVESNMPSKKTAEKLDFKLIKETKVYWFDIN